jgi:hypothetical protein
VANFATVPSKLVKPWLGTREKIHDPGCTATVATSMPHFAQASRCKLAVHRWLLLATLGDIFRWGATTKVDTSAGNSYGYAARPLRRSHVIANVADVSEATCERNPHRMLYDEGASGHCCHACKHAGGQPAPLRRGSATAVATPVAARDGNPHR